MELNINQEQNIDVSNHDLHQKLIDPYNETSIIAINCFLNENYQKLRSYPWFTKTAQFPRVLQNMIKR